MTTNPAGGVDQVFERIMLLLWRRKMSQAQLAQAVGINKATMSRKLHGHVPLTMFELYAIAGALDVHPAELLGGVGATDDAGVVPADVVADTPMRRGNAVRHQGLEPRTRWFEARRRSRHLAVVA